MVVIGLAGKALAGKDTIGNKLAEILFEKYNLRVKTFSFADPLKEECAEATGLPREWFDDKEYKETLRPLMQWWGTEFRRNPHLNGTKHYWTNKASDMVKASGELDVVIFRDTRFDDEASFVKTLSGNGEVWLIVCPDAPTTGHVEHASEAGITSNLISKHVVNSRLAGLESIPSLVEGLASDLVRKYGLNNDQN